MEYSVADFGGSVTDIAGFSRHYQIFERNGHLPTSYGGSSKKATVVEC
jgi:hypothetical protein